MKKRYFVNGMHCASCELLIKRKLEKLPDVKSVSFAGNRIFIEEKKKIPQKVLQKQLLGTEYELSSSYQFPFKDVVNGILVVILGYYILRLFHFESYMQLDSIGVGVALLMGVLASLSSCMAVTGGLLLTLTSRAKNPLVYSSVFNISRVLSYTVFGALLGYVGTFFQISATLNGIISMIISLVMIVLGLQLLGVIPPLFTMGFQKTKIKDHSLKNAGFIGAASFFFPCGFTQALQLFAIASADPVYSALLLFVFSIGTLPALLGIGFITNVVKGAIRARITAAAATIIVVIGALMILPSLTLLGVSSPSFAAPQQAEQVVETVPLVGDVQVAQMAVDYLSYKPHQFVVKKGVPVEWKIDASNAVGCARVLQAPKLGINEILPRGETTITFVPEQTGEYAFHCSMAMTTPGAKFIVVE